MASKPIYVPLRIAHYRKRAGLSQGELARQLRIRRETLSRLENGRQYLTEPMERHIARTLGLSDDERHHMLGLPFPTGAAGRVPRPGPDSNRRLWLVRAPAGSGAEQ